MKNIFICAVLLIFCLPLFAQKMEIWRNPPPVVCPHGGDNIGGHKYVPPPKNWQNYLKNGRIEARSKIEVTYVGFSDSAKVAFQKAVDIWQSLLISPVTIRIRAEWAKLGSGVLGAAGPNGLIRNFEGAPRLGVWYPIALAEKLYGKDINKPEDFDINATFNSNQSAWYYGTDGRTPANKFDLVYIVLHELGHGLGFTAVTIDVTNGKGLWFDNSTPNVPDIFSTFVENSVERKPIVAYPNNTTELATVLTNGSIVFNSPATLRANNNIPPALYAPDPYQNGSSISHFDPNFFGEGMENSLMNPRAPRGIAVHSPGAVMLAMFADMGWVATSFKHTPKDQPDPEKKVRFAATVSSDTTFFADSLFLVYSTDTFKTSKTLKVPYDAGKKEAAVELDAFGKGMNLQYYFKYKDAMRHYTSPANSPKLYWIMTVGEDVTPPALTHTPTTAINENDVSLEFVANSSDRNGLKSLVVEYQINNVTNTLNFQKTANTTDLYKITLDLVGKIKAGDSFRYRIISTDSSKNANKTILPKEDFYTIKIEGLGGVRNFYTNSFDNIENSREDFMGTRFKIEKPEGFSSPAIHSEHPYQKAGAARQLNFTYVLRYPIKVKDGQSYMEFDEIVLVEPGENGVNSYLDESFYDYVIVEGSTDKGKTWKAAINGYDSRDRSEWLSSYEGGINGNDSEAKGNPSLFRRRLIDLKKNFKTGDEVVFRFRLFSDPEAAGWGWAIDNLDIQGIATGLEDYLLNAEAFEVYPNPNSGRFSVRARFQKNVPTMEMTVTNILGKTLRKEQFEQKTAVFEHEINLHDLPNGIYFVNLKMDNQSVTRKVILQK